MKALLIIGLSLLTTVGYSAVDSAATTETEALKTTAVEKTGDVITLMNGEVIRANVKKLRMGQIVYTLFGESDNVKHRLRRHEIRSIEYDGVMQLRRFGKWRDYEVMGITEETAMVTMQRGRQFVAVGFINGGVGLTALGAMTGRVPFPLGESGGFITAVFGSRMWLPAFVAGGTNIQTTKKRHLVLMEESDQFVEK